MASTATPPQLGPLQSPLAEASSAYLPTWRAEQLAKSKVKAVRLAVARNSLSPPDALRSLHTDRYEDIRYAVARHRNCPRDVLAVLAGDLVPRVRFQVVISANTSPSVLAEFTRSEDHSIQIAALQNENCPRSALVALMKTVRATAAVAAPEEQRRLAVLRQLIGGHRNYVLNDLRISKDPSRAVRLAAAENPASGEKLLRALWAVDDDLLHRSRIIDNPSCPADVLREAAMSGREHLVCRAAKHPKTPPEVWGEVWADLSVPDRCTLATMPHTPAALLGQLARDPSSTVRQAVATSPLCPVELLWGLRNDEAEIVARIVCNPNCSQAVLDTVVSALQPPAEGKVVRLLAEALAASPLPPLLWEVVYATKLRGVCGLLIANDACPTSILQRMIYDPRDDISHAARGALHQREILTRHRQEQAQRLARTDPQWSSEVAIYGRAAEVVAWALLCDGFGGTLADLAAVAVGTC